MLLFVVLIAIIIILAVYNSPNFKGRDGERIVAEKLENVEGKKYVINNIMINDNGKSRQIDHILISEHGIFVIETKNFAGAIYGKETSTEWKQYLNGKCFKFKNPIHQNYGHLEIVKNILHNITEEIYSVVIFTSRSNLRIETATPVVYDRHIVNFINNKPKILDSITIDQAYEVINQNAIVNEETIKEHNSNVKQYIQYKEEIANKGVCPRCGGKLIQRNGKNGTFFGCSNYPKCRYTK